MQRETNKIYQLAVNEVVEQENSRQELRKGKADCGYYEYQVTCARLRNRYKYKKQQKCRWEHAEQRHDEYALVTRGIVNSLVENCRTREKSENAKEVSGKEQAGESL